MHLEITDCSRQHLQVFCTIKEIYISINNERALIMNNSMLVCEWSCVKLFNPYPRFRNREILDLTNIRAHLFGNNDEADKEIRLGRKYRKGSNWNSSNSLSTRVSKTSMAKNRARKALSKKRVRTSEISIKENFKINVNFILWIYRDSSNNLCREHYTTVYASSELLRKKF